MKYKKVKNENNVKFINTKYNENNLNIKDNKIIGIGADHAGFLYKKLIKEWLTGYGYEVIDFGFFNEESQRDYRFVEDLALALKEGKISKGICICGTGVAVSICANKIKGIRAALCNEIFTAKMSRMHNDANVLAFGSRVIGIEVAKEIVKVWLETEFEGGRHAERKKYTEYLENKYFL